MNRNFTAARSRRRLPPFLRSPALPAESDSLPEAGELLALRGRQAGLAMGAIGAGALDAVAQRRFGQIEIAGDAAHALAPSSSTSRTAWALKSSSNRRRGRRLEVSAI